MESIFFWKFHPDKNAYPKVKKYPFPSRLSYLSLQDPPPL